VKTRELILDRVRRNQPAATPLPDIPSFDARRTATLEAFETALLRMGGTLVEPPAEGSLDAFIRARFPGWEDRVTYWHVHDVDAAHPEDALDEIEQLVRELIAQLRAPRKPPAPPGDPAPRLAKEPNP